MTVILNKTYGGFRISAAAMAAFLTLKGIQYTTKETEFDTEFIGADGKKIFLEGLFKTELALRTDPDLIQVVTALREESWGNCAKLALIEVPDGIPVAIADYDGVEWVEEIHRTWD